MTLDDLIEQLTALRAASTGASIANVRMWIPIVNGGGAQSIDRPVERVFYQGGEIVLSTTYFV